MREFKNIVVLINDGVPDSQGKTIDLSTLVIPDSVALKEGYNVELLQPSFPVSSDRQGQGRGTLHPVSAQKGAVYWQINLVALDDMDDGQLTKEIIEEGFRINPLPQFLKLHDVEAIKLKPEDV
jgi:hypothetical protein